MNENDNPHLLHRNRLKARFLREGASRLDAVTFLELFLFFSHPRDDTRPLAAALLENFGSLNRIADAPAERLKEIAGVKEHTAVLLKLIPELSRRYLETDQDSCVCFFEEKFSSKLAVNFLSHYTEENVGLFCLDAAGNLLDKCVIHRGGINSASFSVSRIAEKAYENNSRNIILAHNHPNKVAFPSAEDLDTTDRLNVALRNIGINLIEHFIVAGEKYCAIING